MPNYKEIARLKATRQSNRSIAESLGISRNTVNQVVTRIEESGLDFEDLSRLTEAEISVVFPINSGRKPDGEYFMPDFEELKKELAKPGVTLQLLWEEYSDRCRLSGRRPYQKTQFKKHFNDHLKKTGFKDIIQHKAGEQIEVDWAGVRPCWQDPDSGEKVYGWLFAAVLPFSGLGFAWVTREELISRKNNTADRYRKSAHLSQNYAELSGIDYRPERKINERVIEQLSTGNYINKARNVVIVGACGTGKTYIANMLARSHRIQRIVRKYTMLRRINRIRTMC